MFESLVKDTLESIVSGGWVAFAAFGLYLGYKLALTTVISISSLKIAGKIVDMFSRPSSDQRLIQIAAAAKMVWPLTNDEWDILINMISDAERSKQQAAQPAAKSPPP